MVGSRQGSLPSVTLGGTTSILAAGGLFRYTPNSDTKPVKPCKRLACLNASDKPVAEPKCMPEGPEVVKQGAKQGKGMRAC